MPLSAFADKESRRNAESHNPGKLLFEDGMPLTFGEFMRGILTLRGSNQTTVKDFLRTCLLYGCEAVGVPERSA